MRALTEKLLATGVIPEQAIRLLKLWGTSFDQLPEEVRQAKTTEELLNIVEEIAEIIEKDEEVPELRETEFDLETARSTMRSVSVEVNVGGVQKLYIDCQMGVTVGGRYVVFLSKPCPSNMDNLSASRGNIIKDGNKKLMVMAVEPRYTGEALSHYVLTVEDMHA